MKSFLKTMLGNDEPPTTKFIDCQSIQETVFDALEREWRRTLCQQSSGKLEGDKVLTCFNNIKRVQKKYIITAAFGTENSPCIIFFKLCKYVSMCPCVRNAGDTIS